MKDEILPSYCWKTTDVAPRSCQGPIAGNGSLTNACIQLSVVLK